MPLSAPLPSGTLLENRYNVVQFIGHGGFGRTYLVHDQHRFNERCVLKEFAPQVNQPSVLQKAEELFQREAGTLYKLNHPQIPEFRALSSVQYNGESVLFIVEQFIDGDNYGEWLESGHCLSITQGLQLLKDLLPVLSYIHRYGVIHRDISPDNLMCDQATGLPVLIDFGSVKRVTETALRLVGGATPATQIHKLGYTPPEQIKGEAYPSSDLYALAVTVLVLMTGKSPSDLYQAKTNEWQWRSLIKLDTRFENVLWRMLARYPGDRYSSADEVMRAIADLVIVPSNPTPPTVAAASPPTIPPSPPPQTAAAAPSIAASHQPLSTIKTVAVAPAWQSPPPERRRQNATAAGGAVQAAPGYAAHSPSPPIYQSSPGNSASPPQPYVSKPAADNGFWKLLGNVLWLPWRLIQLPLKLIWGVVRVIDMMFNWIFRLILIVCFLGGAAIAMMFGQPDWLSSFSLPSLPSFSLPSLPSIAQKSQPSQGCRDLEGRASRAGMSYSTLNRQVNDRFYQRYPQVQGRALTDSAQDQPLRDAWCDIADSVMQRVEK